MIIKRFLFMLSAVMVLWAFNTDQAFAQKGKITGIVTDAKTGEPLPGVNVVIEGTTIGSATDIDGYYVILNVEAGSYILRFSYVGYAPYIVNNVEVNIGLTTEVNAKVTEEVFEGEEIVVQAERPVVQVDISSNQANISKEEIKNMPISSVTAVVGLQAGVEGLTIRGGGSDNIAFNVDGVTMRDERTNQPLSNVSLTSISNIQVQTGGFNAEYGNIRSGLINITTKEGSRERFEVDALVRYTPAQDKITTQLPNHLDSYYVRPFLDDDVAWTGTESGAWDEWTRKQYPSFVGWNKISETLLSDDDPNNDLTPESAQQLFLWQYRKKFDITNPDYDIDLNIGGPVWGVSKMLGDLRFNFSMRKTQSMYIIPLATDRITNDYYSIKLTSDIDKGMKLSFDGSYGHDYGTSASRTGAPGFFESNGGIAGALNQQTYGNAQTFSNFYWSPSSRDYFSLGASFTHTISPTTFYEVKLNNVTTQYSTNPGAERDTTKVFSVGGIGYDEAPFGFFATPSNAIGSGMRMGVGMSTARDSSSSSTTTLRFDLTSQVNKTNQVKTGLEFNHTASKVNYAQVDSYLSSSNTYNKWNRNPLRFAAYVQDKLEFKGMVTNIGLRMDVSSPGGDWYTMDDPYNKVFASSASGLDTLLNKKTIKTQVYFSPRLGISFPITVSSKLFFNYGHFYNMPTPDVLYRVQAQEGDIVKYVSNPNIKLQKTVAYELGYEQSLSEQYLIRVSGYYQDVRQQPASVTYVSSNGSVNYAFPEANSYRDTRGLEITAQKVKGKFFRASANYTYRVSSTGIFDFRYQYQNRNDQKNYEYTTTANVQSKPIPTPFARLILDFFTPKTYGPAFGEIHPLGGWNLNTVTSWRAGTTRTWTGGGSIPGVVNNVQDVDTYYTNVRFSRDFKLSKTASLNIFGEISNIFGFTYINLGNSGFSDGNDYLEYMRSLHMPKKILDKIKTGYPQVPIAGKDKPGDYRKRGVDFVPIVTTNDVANISNPSERPLYYDYQTGTYYQFKNGQMVTADKKFVKKVLKDKAYIDMPNLTFLNFYGDNRIYRFGFRITF